MTININIRPSTGKTFQLQVDAETTTVEQLKELISAQMGDVSASDLKLVFSGRILKNEDLCSDCKIKDGNTIHVVRSGKNRAPAAATQSSSASSEEQPQQREPIPPIPPTPSPSTLSGLGNPFGGNAPPPSGGMGGFGGFGGFGNGEMPNMDPELMRQMMDSPFMQNLMGNTDFVRSIIMSNPQMKAMIEQNPELGHVISDPAFLRQSMEMMRNPELMREMQRNNDRALSNIEAIPGGFNHLRRLYNTVQGPLDSAMSPGGGSARSDEANNNERLARQLNVESVPENSLNTQALPNPWAPTSNNNTNNTTSTNNNNQRSSTNNNNNNNNNNPATAGGFPSFGGGNLSSLLGSGSLYPFGSVQQQQSNNNNDQQQQASGGNTQNTTPFWADPNFIQTSMRIHQAMMEANSNNSSNNNNSNNNNNQQQQPGVNPFLQQMFSGFPMGGFGFPDQQQQQQQQQNQLQEPPEVRFRDQLAQLEEMGFSEKQANVRALLATGGNVQAAIEYLFSSN